MKFTATLFSVAAVAAGFVSEASAGRADTNAGRMARGLPPLKPRNLFDDKRHRALAPRQSSSPIDLNTPLAIPGGTCACGYGIYGYGIDNGDYYPPSPSSAFETIQNTQVVPCQRACDSDPQCSSGIFVDGTCTLYTEFGAATGVPAPQGLIYFEYNSDVQTCENVVSLPGGGLACPGP